MVTDVHPFVVSEKTFTATDLLDLKYAGGNPMVADTTNKVHYDDGKPIPHMQPCQMHEY